MRMRNLPRNRESRTRSGALVRPNQTELERKKIGATETLGKDTDRENPRDGKGGNSTTGILSKKRLAQPTGGNMNILRMFGPTLFIISRLPPEPITMVRLHTELAQHVSYRDIERRGRHLNTRKTFVHHRTKRGRKR